MSTIDTTKKPVPRSFYPLAVLTLLAVALAIYRLVVGLGPTTNLSDHYPWGLWISVDFFLIPVAGAAFTISLISYFFGREHYHTVIRAAVVAGLIGYIVVGALAFLDVGRWYQIYNIFIPGYINLHSFLEEVSLSITLYSIILIIEFAPIVLEKYDIQKPIKWINRGIVVIAGIGIVISTMHQSSLGSMFLILSHKLHPLWWTPALPILFLLQAIYTGLGMTAIAVRLIWRALGMKIDNKLFYRLGQAMGFTMALYLAIKMGDWMGAGEIPLMLFPDRFGVLAWFEIVIGLFIPLIMLFTRLGNHSAGPFWAGVFALIGTFINRLIISWIGLAEPAHVVYTPTWIEVTITVGLIAGGFLAYGAIVRYFNLFPKGKEAH
ncbi:MAG: polysulfide reductase NrfD [Anaerolineales bacterium]|jgi:Ni/Fe-hydrogenase subunit HybB-like protein